MDRRADRAHFFLISAILLAAAVALGGCAQRRPAPTTTPDLPRAEAPDPDPAADPAAEAWLEGQEGSEPLDTPPAVEEMEVLDPEELTESDPVSSSPLDDLADTAPEPTPEQIRRTRELVPPEPPSFDIPMDVNDRVLAWVDRYTTVHRDAFQAGLSRSGRYLDRFREIFAEEGVPQDLVYMAHVESGYKTSAYSRAHARGIFQFMAATGRRYGLRVDYWADERADPEKSARAAARYMRDLYAEFGDWYLSFAAYNAGEGKVRRAIARTGKRDFWAIARTNYIRRETKNHIPAILAATLISKEPYKYGLVFEPEPLMAYDTIQVEGAADLRVLARCAGTDAETLRALNPALRRNQTPPDGAFDVHVPEGVGAATLAALEGIPRAERVLYARHNVRRGDTLSTIARKYGVPVQAIQQANGLGRSTLIRVNQTLLVPTSVAGRYADLAPPSATAASAAPKGEPLAYRVRSGDTLYAIARRYDTTPASIAAANGISVHSVLRVGQRLTVLPGVRSTAQARVASGGGAAGSGERVLHTVRRGETLWGIASLYRTSVGVLCALNDISPGTTLYPGIKLTVGHR